MSGIKNRGFASMDKERLLKVTSAAGNAAHAMGKAHTFTSEEARNAGKIAGLEARRKGIKRGFALLDNDKRRSVAVAGGKAVQAQGSAHRWTREEAIRVGKLGGRPPKSSKRY
jgi:hypothetical protein